MSTNIFFRKGGAEALTYSVVYRISHTNTQRSKTGSSASNSSLAFIEEYSLKSLALNFEYQNSVLFVGLQLCVLPELSLRYI